MTHNYLSGGLPTAIITRKRNEMRSYDRNNDSVIYLNDKDTFEIRLFNPLQTKVGVEIRINGQSTSDALLVLNPGQDVTLERYIDSKRKFMFETYHIDANNPSAKKAIENNGLVEVFFYNEKVNLPFTTWNTLGTTTRFVGETATPTCFYSSSIDTVGFDDTITLDGTFHLEGNSNVKSSSSGKAKRKRTKSKSQETGVIGKGGKSNQEFEKVNIEFQSFHFHNLEFKLLPASQRTERYDAQNFRNYCPDCGYRIRKTSWEFCPQCGNEI